MSPLHLYRAIAECSACGKTTDVGPFTDIAQATAKGLPGWLLEAAHPPTFVLSDAFGQRFALCPECMARPLREVLADISARQEQQ